MNYQDWIGKEEHHQDLVTPAMLERFRATMGRDETLADEIAPLGFHWCLCLPKAPMEMLSSDGHPTKGDFLPPIPLPRRMWAGSAVTFHHEIKVMAQIERTARIVSIKEKQGASGPLVFVDVQHETTANGLLVVSERQSIVYREAAKAQMSLPEAQGADLQDWPVQRHIMPDPPLLFRYSALTFNTHRIHYDQAYTTDTEGYPGLVVHGPLTATMLLRLAAKEIGPRHIEAFSYQAKSPAFAGQDLHLVAKPQDGALHLAAIGADGRMVMEGVATPTK